ncbi:MAG: phosphoglucomutase/phosphomannomutase family protein [Coriobacteriales bacterium]|jgi:phosphomannomutase|nr:phosphoglucomutase/phosphomannomutase family protein [Coriobacteriales bacterium]
MAKIHFGTDGWRAIIGEDFTEPNLARVIEAVAATYQAEFANQIKSGQDLLVVGYDCRLEADRYALLAAQVLQGAGFRVLLSDAYCPTPCLCWTISRNPQAIGGVMLTSSHNPAEYLGVKLRMPDGGASPKAFTDKLEKLIPDTAAALPQAEVTTGNIVTPYLEDLLSLVDAQAIAGARLQVVVDPMFGAGRHYLSKLLRILGVAVEEVNDAADPTFGGLHPEPIDPWIETGRQAVLKSGACCGFVNDGDADRIGAICADGEFVSPHKILALVTKHLVAYHHNFGRVVRTQSGSNLIAALCEQLGLELTTTPVGFKWIYQEMCKGDVLIGGEESGGIGIPAHVRERDGLLMALLLTEMMAVTGKTLRQLVDALLEQCGDWHYQRRDLKVSPAQIENFKAYAKAHREGPYDGIKQVSEDGSWLLLRASGTEPLVRIYAEATTDQAVRRLLDEGEKLATEC